VSNSSASPPRLSSEISSSSSSASSTLTMDLDPFQPKYQPPTTPATTTLMIPRTTPQLHNQTPVARNMAYGVQVLRCHSSLEAYPIRERRNMSVRKGILPSSAMRSRQGDKTSRRGCEMRMSVDRLSRAAEALMRARVRGRSNWERR